MLSVQSKIFSSFFPFLFQSIELICTLNFETCPRFPYLQLYQKDRIWDFLHHFNSAKFQCFSRFPFFLAFCFHSFKENDSVWYRPYLHYGQYCIFLKISSIALHLFYVIWSLLSPFKAFCNKLFLFKNLTSCWRIYYRFDLSIFFTEIWRRV